MIQKYETRVYTVILALDDTEIELVIEGESSEWLNYRCRK